LQTRLIKHLNTHNILAQERYGFRTNLKADDALFNLTNHTLNALNHNSLIVAKFCDLEKVLTASTTKYYELN